MFYIFLAINFKLVIFHYKLSAQVRIQMQNKIDKIELKGPKADVERVRLGLQTRVDKLKTELCCAVIIVEPKFHKYVVGKRGATIQRITQATGATIRLPKDNNSSFVEIEGSTSGVAQAKAEILNLLIVKKNDGEKEIKIEQRFYKNIIGFRGEKIREIRAMFNQVLIAS